MPQINVTIAGRSYRMACGEGEEAHLEALARGFDAKVGEMREAFGEIGDMRLHVMASLALSDEMAELRGRLELVEGALAAAQARAEAEVAGLASVEGRVSEAVVRVAERVERLARGLGPG